MTVLRCILHHHTLQARSHTNRRPFLFLLGHFRVGTDFLFSYKNLVADGAASCSTQWRHASYRGALVYDHRSSRSHTSRDSNMRFLFIILCDSHKNSQPHPHLLTFPSLPPFYLFILYFFIVDCVAYTLAGDGKGKKVWKKKKKKRGKIMYQSKWLYFIDLWGTYVYNNYFIWLDFLLIEHSTWSAIRIQRTRCDELSFPQKRMLRSFKILVIRLCFVVDGWLDGCIATSWKKWK